MAKRMRDTGKWRGWYRELSPLMKNLIDYLCDECDHAGIFKEDYGLASFLIGAPVTREDVSKHLAGKVIRVDDDKLFIPSFVEFQYSLTETDRLNPANKVHASVIKQLRRYGIDPITLTPIQPLPSPILDPTKALRRVYEEGEEEGYGEEEGKRKGGVGEKQIPPSSNLAPPSPLVAEIKPPTAEELESCYIAWLGTLRHFKSGRKNILPHEQTEIFRATQRYGSAKAVAMAIEGARDEPKSDKWDPGKFLKLSRILESDHFNRFLNLGVQAANRKEGA